MKMSCKGDLVIFTPETELDVYRLYRLGRLSRKMDTITLRWEHDGDGKYILGYAGIHKDDLLKELIGEVWE